MRALLETAESISSHFQSLDELGDEARKLVGRVRSTLARVDADGIDPLADALSELRSRSREVFDDLTLQILCGADWWPLIGTELSTINDEYARIVIEIQDMKYQTEEGFYSQLRALCDCEGACALIMFGNDATDDDMNWINFRRYTQLELLDLAENRLRAVPLGVERLPVLRKLSLSKNRRLKLGPRLAERWDTPKLEELDIRETDCDPEFTQQMKSKYPDTKILHD